MKYPLNRWHRAERQLMCFFFGHKWKCSPFRETQYWGMEKKDVPYAYRKSTGNYMFENIAWWSSKCVRCRRINRHSDWKLGPWYRTLYYGIINGFSAMITTVEVDLFRMYNGASKYEAPPIWKRLVATPILMLAHGFEQFYVSFYGSSLPMFPLGLALDIHYNVDEWLNHTQSGYRKSEEKE